MTTKEEQKHTGLLLLTREGFPFGQAVNEVNIAYVGYSPAESLMRVEYTNGAQYNYQDVPENVWTSVRDADSKGAFLAQSIKGNYRYYRVNGD